MPVEDAVDALLDAGVGGDNHLELDHDPVHEIFLRGSSIHKFHLARLEGCVEHLLVGDLVPLLEVVNVDCVLFFLPTFAGAPSSPSAAAFLFLGFGSGLTGSAM